MAVDLQLCKKGCPKRASCTYPLVHTELSERRANAVKSYLVAQGVDNARIVALGYGESHPISDNSTPAGRARNRRVDLLLKAK